MASGLRFSVCRAPMVRRKLLKIGILADLVPLASCDEEERNVVMRLRVSLRDPDGNAVEPTRDWIPDRRSARIREERSLLRSIASKKMEAVVSRPDGPRMRRGRLRQASPNCRSYCVAGPILMLMDNANLFVETRGNHSRNRLHPCRNISATGRCAAEVVQWSCRFER